MLLRGATLSDSTVDLALVAGAATASREKPRKSVMPTTKPTMGRIEKRKAIVSLTRNVCAAFGTKPAHRGGRIDAV